jgi:hypothetical protein
MEILHRLYQDYVASGDGQTTFDVPSGTESVERVVVAGRELKPGTDYRVTFRPRDHFGPLSVTLEAVPQKGDHIAIYGIVWKRKGRRK